MAQNPMTSAEVFLKIADQFKLGDLPTEQSHPLTVNLSTLAKENLDEALQRLKTIDVEALKSLLKKSLDLENLRSQVESVLAQRGRIYICGCGATGRLALTLETIDKELRQDRVTAFMAGGDVALVHAIEGFEDHPEYGARQLAELGFTKNDFLICCTEGGETPFVIGAALKAAEISEWPVAFMFCNPEKLLASKLDRCAEVFNHPNIKSIELSVGPMALCGSTRLQASTVLMLGAGLALFTDPSQRIEKELQNFIQYIQDVDYLKIKDFVRAEAEAYKKSEKLIYQVEELAISVFTDTTERAPTFSLQAFQTENSQDVEPAWSFIEFQSAKDEASAWQKILKRKPRSLNWNEINPKTGDEYMHQFDFSSGAASRREKKWPKFNYVQFSIRTSGKNLEWKFKNHQTSFNIGGLSLLFQHTLLKLLLNAHSTLIMGALGRYEGNWMTYVYPTNAKLVDRATRYILGILKREGITPVYDDVVRALFAKFPIEKRGQSVVLEIVEEFK